LAELMSLCKRYPWPRPGWCLRCGGWRLWGHGYVPRYFDGFAEPLWIKRWRCPDCGAVHICRPDSHWCRFLAPIATILVSLASKFAGLPWPRAGNDSSTGIMATSSRAGSTGYRQRCRLNASAEPALSWRRIRPPIVRQRPGRGSLPRACGDRTALKPRK